jgi:hypothetical protein
MLPVSSFSIAATQLRQLLADEITDLDARNIHISHPKDVNVNNTVQALNLFFYRVEYGGYPSDVSSHDPFYVRLHCLVTALGSDETTGGGGGGGGGPTTVTAGENDLRLIGEVMRVLHENSSIPLADENQPLMLQAVYLPLSLDDLNHVWSTQADTAYRLSIAYEFALVPVPLTSATRSSPLVGAVGIDTQANLSQPQLPQDGFNVSASSPEVPRVVINTQRANWTPHICFLQDSQTLRYVLRIPDTQSTTDCEVLVAGAEGATVQLVWESWHWDYDSNSGGWSPEEPDSSTPEAQIPSDDDPSNPLLANIIDPQAIDTRLQHSVTLPFTAPPAEDERRQALLYAVRQWERVRPQADVEVITVRSNPLLVSIYHEEAGP